MDLQRLREDTRGAHENAERALPLMQPDLSRDTYVAALRAMLPLLQTWDRWSTAHVSADLHPLLAGRQRSPLLLADLHALHAAPAPSAPFHPDPDFAAPWLAARTPAERDAAFLGLMYVIEGSTLGGQFLARHAEQALGLTPGHGNAYFLGYGDATAERWRNFRAILAALPDHLAPTVTHAAQVMFSCFENAVSGASSTSSAAI